MSYSSLRKSCLLIPALLALLACSSEGQQTTEAETNSPASAAESSSAVLSSTVAEGYRLTDEAIQSYLPANLGGYTLSGSPQIETSKVRSSQGQRLSLRATYSSPEQDNLFLTLIDFADDPATIQAYREGQVQVQNMKETSVSNQTKKNKQGWYISHYQEYFPQGTDTTFSRRRLSLQSPRILVELESKPRRGSIPLSFSALNEFIEQSTLSRLFTLEVPRQDVVRTETATSRLSLNCSEILPLERVERLCQARGLQLKTTDFEQNTNCNRVYKFTDSTGGLVFIISQYAQSSTARKAVQAKLSDNDLPVNPVPDLGQLASLVTVGDDLFLSVAQDQFLIELRASRNKLNPDAACCLCLNRKNLVSLAREALANLPR